MAADESKKSIDETTPEVTAPAKKRTAGAKPAKSRAAKPKNESGATAKAKAEKPAAKKPAAKRSAPAKKAAAEAKAEKPAKAVTPKAETPEAEEATGAEAAKPARAAREKAAKPKTKKAAGRRTSRSAAPAVAEPPARTERPLRVRAEKIVHEPRRAKPGTASVVDETGSEVGTKDLVPERFAVPADLNALHLVVRAEQAARRRGTASTKTRGEITGSTAKLYRQKGTGRARAGSAKSPLRTGGGTVFGPRPRSFEIKVNRKVLKKALAMALSNRAENGNVFVAAGLDLEEPSTRRLNEALTAIDCAAPVLVITHDEPAVAKSARNLFYAETTEVVALSTEQVLRARSLVLTEKAFDALNKA